MTFDSFFDRLGDLDWLAVVVGAIVLMVLGWLWYGPLFGKQWSAGTGISMDGGAPPANKLVGTFVYSFVVSAAVGYFGALDEFEHAIVMGLLLGLLVIGAAMYSAVVWSNRKTNVWVIDTLFWVVGIAVTTYVQGLML